MLLFSKQLWEQANACGWLGGAESHEPFWKNNCQRFSNRWWVHLRSFPNPGERVLSLGGTRTSETWGPCPRACSWRGHQRTSRDLFLTVTRELLVLHFAPDQITKLSMDASAGRKVNGTGCGGIRSTSIFQKQRHVMPQEVNPWNHGNLTHWGPRFSLAANQDQ